jgi:hypothetical protein
MQNARVTALRLLVLVLPLAGCLVSFDPDLLEPPNEPDAGRDAAADCAEGLTACDGTCVNTDSNDDHCGRCGQRCVGQRTCIEGVCVN